MVARRNLPRNALDKEEQEEEREQHAKVRGGMQSLDDAGRISCSTRTGVA